jgi:predicted lipid-binding transport protein (Tim44 family)
MNTPEPRPEKQARRFGRIYLIVVTSLVVFLPMVISTSVALARVGGGQSYGGGSHGGGGGGGGGGGDCAAELVCVLFQLLFQLTVDHPVIGIPIDLLVIALIVGGIAITRNSRSAAPPIVYSSQRRAEEAPARMAPVGEGAFEALRHYDPNFSQILFTDFTYALFARVQEARGRKELPEYAPYLAPLVIKGLQGMSGPDLRGVTGVIVGASHVISVSNPERPKILIVVEFETNYTEEFSNGRSTTWYTKEQWTFVRNRDILSRPPDKITAIHCPKCGGALALTADGACQHCGVKIVGGDFDWFVTRVNVLTRENRGPLLTQDVPEVGSNWPTIYQPHFNAVRQRFLAINPNFAWPRLKGRVRHIFLELQAAWTERRWERARPYVSDSFFQTQLYWIAAYQKQHLRNVLKDVQIGQVEPVKITMDPFHDALTFRIFASMIDFTADEENHVVSGNPNAPRRFSEYWTFIRHRGVNSSDKDNVHCPNCGAPLKVNMAGVCEYCQGKITDGAFDWVLSRIEQDESYQG